jgi:hypothetical protein
LTTKPEGNVERLAALIDTKLSDLETRAAEGEVPSGADLNAVRRLVAWAEQQRQLSLARELTSSPETAERV